MIELLETPTQLSMFIKWLEERREQARQHNVPNSINSMKLFEQILKKLEELGLKK